jgi:hypothetical protein
LTLGESSSDNEAQPDEESKEQSILQIADGSPDRPEHDLS